MTKRDHGGGIDAARARYGGGREAWVDLSTGINPSPYPIGTLTEDLWTTLPDHGALNELEEAARTFWNVPDDAEIVAAPGASALIAALPGLWPADRVDIPTPTYNEHLAAFHGHGWKTGRGTVSVVVNPNNPDGKIWTERDLPDTPIRIIDESFCDIAPDATLVALSSRPGQVILKSFGKFWGLAGLRLGFAICNPDLAARLRARIGPWAVSGPALAIGTAALQDRTWAAKTRKTLGTDAARLSAMLTDAGFTSCGGTDLFKLVACNDAERMAQFFAESKILVRHFPYSSNWLRFGLPAGEGWTRLERTLERLR